MTHPLMLVGLLFFVLALRNFSRAPYLATRWLVIFSYVWVYFPAVVFMGGDADSLEYSLYLFSLTGQSFRGNDLYPLVLTILFLTIAQSLLGPKKLMEAKKAVPRIEISSQWLWVCMIGWLFIGVVVLGEGDPYKFSQLFVPAYYDEGKYKSYLLRLLFLFIPMGVSAALVAREGLSRFSCPIIAIAALASLGSGQRRDAVTFALLLMAILYFGRGSVFIAPRRVKLRTVSLFIVSGLALSPVLWAARVVFTNYFVTGVWIDPFEVRSLIDVTLGSGATGPFTYLTIVDYVERYGERWGYSFYYGLTQFIPRSIWPDKPVDIDTFIESEYNLTANPSAFWMGDMYFSFGSVWWLVFLLVAFILDRFQIRLMRRRSLLPALLNVSMLANCFALFKNGLGSYIVSVLSVLVGLGICFLPRLWRQVRF